jgi:hypothetical protein
MQFDPLKRREFITLVGGAVARAQQVFPGARRARWFRPKPRCCTYCLSCVPLRREATLGERVRRIGVLMGFAENDPEARLWIAEFTQGLSELGWIVGRNLRMDIRWEADSSSDQMRIFAKELVSLQPDVILSSTTTATDALHRETRTIHSLPSSASRFRGLMSR